MELFKGLERMLYGRRIVESVAHNENVSISQILAREIKRRNGMRDYETARYLDWLKTKRFEPKESRAIADLEKVFGFKRSLDYTKSINKDNPEMPDILESFDMAQNEELISTLLDYPELYRFQSGLILSGVSFDSLSREIQNKLNPKRTQASIRPKSHHKGWYLCDSSETYLDWSIKEKCVMTAGDSENKLFLMKFHGYLSGICLQNFITPEGRIFIKGNWYLPTGTQTCDRIEKAFNSDLGRVYLKAGDWALMKAVREQSKITTEDLIQNTVNISNAIPDKYDSDVVYTHFLKFKYSRAEYLNNFGKRYPEHQYDKN